MNYKVDERITIINEDLTKSSLPSLLVLGRMIHLPMYLGHRLFLFFELEVDCFDVGLPLFLPYYNKEKI
jgi:hypothetical protein